MLLDAATKKQYWSLYYENSSSSPTWLTQKSNFWNRTILRCIVRNKCSFLIFLRGQAFISFIISSFPTKIFNQINIHITIHSYVFLLIPLYTYQSAPMIRHVVYDLPSDLSVYHGLDFILGTLTKLLFGNRNLCN